MPNNSARTIRIILAVAAACVPLAGTFFLGWDVREVLLLYWAENLVIGFWQIIKMAAATPRDSLPGDHLGKLFMIPFFLLHYGGFCAGHGFFILMLSSINKDGNLDGMPDLDIGSMDALGPFVFLQLLWKVIAMSLTILPPAAYLAVAAMFVSHGINTWHNFFANDEWRSDKTESRDLMGEPYKHIIVVHIAIIAGGFCAMWLKNAIPVLLVIIIGKLLIDWRGIVKAKGDKKGSEDVAQSSDSAS